MSGRVGAVALSGRTSFGTAGNRSGLSGFREECSALERKRLRVFPSYGSGMLLLSGMLGLSLLRFVRSE